MALSLGRILGEGESEEEFGREKNAAGLARL